MSEGDENPGEIQRLAADLKRPGGGWTTGVLTLLGAMAVPLVEVFGIWPGPSWSATVAGVALIALHLMWGAHGYYPRRMG